MNSGEVKHRNDRSQRFHFNSSEVSVVKRLSEEKRRSERSQRFHLHSSESETVE